MKKLDDIFGIVSADYTKEEVRERTYQPKPSSWDYAISPVLWKDSFVFGSNGSGYETLCEKHSSLRRKKDAFCDAKHFMDSEQTRCILIRGQLT